MQPYGVLAAGNTLGEGIVWDSRRSRLWWTDIPERRLYCRQADGRTLVHALPERAAALALVAGSEQLLVAFASGLALFDPAAATRQALFALPPPLHGVRFNDGRVDRDGRFWCGSMVEDASGEAKARLYRLERGAAQALQDNIYISNSIAFSLDGRAMYFADSARHVIWRFALADGMPGARTLFAQTPAHVFPDGASIDSDGCLWVAHWGGAEVVRYAPDGRIDRVVPVPVSQPSCVCFGGAQRDLLFVTSARVGLAPGELAQQPHAGDVLVYRVGASGVDEPEYRR